MGGHQQNGAASGAGSQPRVARPVALIHRQMSVRTGDRGDISSLFNHDMDGLNYIWLQKSNSGKFINDCYVTLTSLLWLKI